MLSVNFVLERKMALKKSNLSEAEHTRLKRVLTATGDDLSKIREAVTTELTGVSKINGWQYLFSLLSRHAEKTIKARLKKAKTPPKEDKRLKDIKFLANDARRHDARLLLPIPEEDR